MLHTSILSLLTLALATNATPLPAPAPAPEPFFDLFQVPNSVHDSLDQLEQEIDSKFDTDGAEQTYPEIFKKNPELFKLHEKLIRIESISGNELSVSKYLQSYLKNLGLGFELSIDATGKNIYAYSTENGSAPVLLTSHIDTVPPFIDYSIKELDDGSVEIHGRGANDDKGSIAAQIIAAKELLEEGLITIDELSMLFVFAEEVGGAGMQSASEYFIENNINWDTVIFGEPTENKLAIGHKGIYMAFLEVFGLASHSGYPDVGIDADKILIDIMYELEHYPWPVSESLNKTTINVGMFRGGTAGNVISPYSTCEILMRTSVDIDQIAPVVEEIVEKYRSVAKDINFKVAATADPVSLDHTVDGFETYIASYATDIPNLKHRGFKRYLYGPGSILVAHGDNEYVTAESLLKAVEDLKKLVLHSLGRL